MHRPRSDRARRCVQAAFFVVLLPTLFAVCWHALPVRPRGSWNTDGKMAFCCFSPDGRTLVIQAQPERWDVAGPLRLWDVDTGRERLALAADWSSIKGVEFSPDGRLLAAKNDGHHLKLWDVTTGEEWADLRLERLHNNYVNSCFTPDGRYLVFQRYGRPAGPGEVDTLHFWDVRAKQERAIMEGCYWALAFAPDGKRFGLFHLPDEGYITEVQTWVLGEEPGSVTMTRREGVIEDRLIFAPDLESFASATYTYGSDQPADVKVWDLATGTVRATTTHFDRETRIQRLSFTPDGQFLTATSGGGTSRYNWKSKSTVWDVRQGLEVVYDGPVEPVFSPDGQWLAIRDETGADLIDTRSRRKGGELRDPRDGPYPWRFCSFGNEKHYPPLAFAADGRTAFVRGLSPGSGRLSGGRLPGWLTPFRPNPFTTVDRLWDTAAARELVTLKGCAESLFSPDGKRLAVRHANGRVDIWDVPPQKPIQAPLYLSLAGWLAAVAGAGLVRAGRRGRME